RAGGGLGGATSDIKKRRRRHHRAAAGHAAGGGAGRHVGGADDHRSGAIDHPAELRPRHPAAAARTRHRRSRPPGCRAARGAAGGRGAGAGGVPAELAAAASAEPALRHGDGVMDAAAVVALFPGLTLVELTAWVERGWVIPDAAGTALEFREIDVARVRLIHDLRSDMEVGEDTVPLVLSLLDQVYEL